MYTVLTVGHSNHPLERLLDLLRDHQVEVLVDVRSRPYSRHAPQYNKADLERAVSEQGVSYRFLGRGLGGMVPRQQGESAREAYRRRAEEPDFEQDLEQVAALASEHRVVLMCAEEDPARCHRHLLLAARLGALGAEVVHLRGDGRLQSDGELAPRQLSLL